MNGAAAVQAVIPALLALLLAAPVNAQVGEPGSVLSCRAGAVSVTLSSRPTFHFVEARNLVAVGTPLGETQSYLFPRAALSSVSISVTSEGPEEGRWGRGVWGLGVSAPFRVWVRTKSIARGAKRERLWELVADDRAPDRPYEDRPSLDLQRASRRR